MKVGTLYNGHVVVSFSSARWRGKAAVEGVGRVRGCLEKC